MRRWHLLALLPLLAVPLSGCVVDNTTVPDEPRERTDDAGNMPLVAWQKQPCDASPATSIAGDVPWVDAWQRDRDALMAAFAAALGEELPPLDTARSGGSWWYYESDDVHFRYTFEDEPHAHGWGEAMPELRYSTPERWPADGAAGKRQIESFLAAFGADDAEGVLILEDRVQQRHGGHVLSGAGGHISRGDGSGRMGWWSSFSFNPLYDLKDADVVVGEPAAIATAEAYLRCVLDDEGHTEAAGYTHRASDVYGLDVANASLVYRIALRYDEPPPYGHCGFGRMVLVDAETGAVHGWEHIPCD